MSALAGWAMLDQWGFAAMRYLLSVLWQSSILFAAALALTSALRRRPASVRHAAWVSALLLAPVLPLLASGLRSAGVPQVAVWTLPGYGPQASGLHPARE